MLYNLSHEKSFPLSMLKSYGYTFHHQLETNKYPANLLTEKTTSFKT